MSLILQPQVNFPIVRQIANHLDTGTYYVRAVVRNASGATIATVDLEDKGGQRFQKEWRVPADPTGRGVYISIVTSVYSDSGYTTKSQNYGDEETTYLVFDRVLPATRGGGGGNGLDAYTIRRIIKEELEKLPEPESFDYSRIPTPERYEMRWDEILLGLDVLRRRLETIESKETDLSAVYDAVAKVHQAVLDKEVTPATELDGVLAQIADIRDDIDVNQRETVDYLQNMGQQLTDTIGEAIDEAYGVSQFVNEYNTVANKKPVNKPEPKVFDLKKLTS